MTNVNNVNEKLWQNLGNKDNVQIDEAVKKTKLGSVFAAAIQTAANKSHRDISIWDNGDGVLTAEEMKNAIKNIQRDNTRLNGNHKDKNIKTKDTDRYTGATKGMENTEGEVAAFDALNDINKDAKFYDWNGRAGKNQYEERKAQILKGQRDAEKSVRVMLRDLNSEKLDQLYNDATGNQSTATAVHAGRPETPTDKPAAKPGAQPETQPEEQPAEPATATDPADSSGTNIGDSGLDWGHRDPIPGARPLTLSPIDQSPVFGSSVDVTGLVEDDPFNPAPEDPFAAPTPAPAASVEEAAPDTAAPETAQTPPAEEPAPDDADKPKNEPAAQEPQYITLSDEDLKEGSERIRAAIKDSGKLKELLDTVDPKQKSKVIALVVDSATFGAGNTNVEALKIALDYVDGATYKEINDYLTQMNVDSTVGERQKANGYGLRGYIEDETSFGTETELLDKLNKQIGYQAYIEGEKGTVRSADIANLREKIKNKTAETKLTQEDAVAAAGFFKRPWESFETRKSLIYSIRDKETLAAVEKELGMSLGLWLENNYEYAECKDLVRHVRQFM